MCDECCEIINNQGTKRRYKKEKYKNLHCLTEPAIQYTNGDWAWFKDDKAHREDGPASFLYGTYSFWLEGIRCDEQDYCVKIKEYRNDKIKDL